MSSTLFLCSFQSSRADALSDHLQVPLHRRERAQRSGRALQGKKNAHGLLKGNISLCPLVTASLHCPACLYSRGLSRVEAFRMTQVTFIKPFGTGPYNGDQIIRDLAPQLFRLVWVAPVP